MKKHDLFQFASSYGSYCRDGFGTDSGLRYTTGAGEGSLRAPNVWADEQMMKELNLTPAQKQQADTIFGNAREKARPIRQEIQQNREALHAAMKANDTAQIERLSAQQGTLMGKTLAIRTESMAKFYATLTPEQRMKADQSFERMKTRMRQRMQDRMQQRKSEDE